MGSAQSAQDPPAHDPPRSPSCCQVLCCCATRRDSDGGPTTPGSAASGSGSGGAGDGGGGLAHGGGSSTARLLEMGKVRSDAADSAADKAARFLKGGHFIMPGSEAQLALARRMREHMARMAGIGIDGGGGGGGGAAATGATLVPQEEEDECVICLGDFTPADPEVLTLCSCGVNKAKFHLACLLSWRDRHRYCPACRGELFYEEHAAMAQLQAARAGSGSGGGM